MIPTEKIEEKSDEISQNEIKVGALCRIHLKIEAGIYAAIAFIISLPLIVGLLITKAVIFITYTLINGFVWVVNNILVPLIHYILYYLQWLFDIIVKCIILIIDLLRWIYKVIKWLWSLINWCIVRSLIRMMAIIVGLFSTGSIIFGFTKYSVSELFTGYFLDLNPDIVLFHTMIVILLLSVMLYYSAWAWSKPEETDVVCKYTSRLLPSIDMMKRMWKK